MTPLTHLELLTLLRPEVVVVITALLVLTVDLTVLREKELGLRTLIAGLLTCVGCVAAMAYVAAMVSQAGVPILERDSMFVMTPVTQLVKEVMLGLTIFTALISFNAKFTRHVGEYYALLLLASTGLLLLVSSLNLLMIFVALELLSLSLYAMVAFNKSSLASSEAALKYFLFGGMAAAFTLFGISLIYGMTGSINLMEIATKLKEQGTEPVLYLALVMTLIGFAFKLAAAPFHLWAPDVYQGAPTPIASFIASGSKVGSFFVLARILMVGFAPVSGSAALGALASGWLPVVAVIAITSMLLGNIAALMQSSVKRLLAYSAIAHGGYALLALFGNREQAVASLLFYVITYALTVLGAFAVVSIVENGSNRETFSDFAGLSRRAPVLSACMGVFMLSLAGIPPLSGFFGKFYVCTAAMGGDGTKLGLIWLVVVAISASAISLYYYLQVLKQIYVVQAPAQPAPLSASPFALAAIFLLAVAVVLLGCAPDLLLGKLTAAVNSLPSDLVL